tara:strand:- start:561 stop:1052 length:492 start_codon:yes stop_codon:yes gene_type:complete
MNALESHVMQVAQIKRRAIVLIKVPEPVIIIERIGAKVSGRLDRRRAVDFHGAIAGGQAVAIECKSTRRKSTRWHLDERFKESQRPLLEQWAALGVWCAVYVRHAVYGDYFLPITAAGLPFVGASCAFEDLEKYKIPPGKCFVDALIRGHETYWAKYKDRGWL